MHRRDKGGCGGSVSPINKCYQDPGDGLCGVACALTVLTTGNVNVSQQQLWLDIQNNSSGNGPGSKDDIPACGKFPKQVCECGSCWCTDPDALVATLNQYLGPTYQVWRASDDDEATAIVRASIDRHVLPAVVVFETLHWIIAYRYECDPNDPATTTYVWVHDPLFTAQQGKVDASHWNANYLRQILCGRFKDTIVVAAPPGVVVGEIQTSALHEHPDAGPAHTAPAPLPPDVIRQHVEAERERLLGHDQAGEWDAALGDVSTSEPLLVRQLASDMRYYLTGFQSRVGREVARMVVDAYTGRMLEVAGISRSGDSPLPPLTPPAGVPDVLRRAGAPWKAPQISSGEMETRVATELVWKPCDQSSTMYQPFYEVWHGDQVSYLRVDGRWFSRLTAFGAGI